MEKNCYYEVENIACKIDESVQIMHYIVQELGDYKHPIDRVPTLDDTFARVETLCYRVYEDSKVVRDNLYKLLDDRRE